MKRVSFIVLSLLTLSACGPGFGLMNNGFHAVGGSSRVTVGPENRPYEAGPSLAERAQKITYEKWQDYDAAFSRSIERFEASEIEWNQQNQIFTLMANATIKGEEVSFSIRFNESQKHSQLPIGARDSTSRYKLELVCASDDCVEKIFRLTRLSDNAKATIKNVRIEKVLVSGSEAEVYQEIPVVHQYTEVQGGHADEQIVSQNDGQPLPDVVLHDPKLLKNYSFKRSREVPELDEADVPGLSQLSTGQKLVFIAELFIKQNVSVFEHACNRFILGVLTASGYPVEHDPDAHGMLTLFKLHSQFRGWRISEFRDHQKLITDLSKLPERSGVILQYPRNQHYSRGHVALLYRDENDFYVIDASLNDHGPKKRRVTDPGQLIPEKRERVNVVYPN